MIGLLDDPRRVFHQLLKWASAWIAFHMLIGGLPPLIGLPLILQIVVLQLGSRIVFLFQEPRVLRPPAHIARKALEFLLSKKTFSLVVDPAIEDMRFEHAQALSEGRTKKARWIVICGHLALARAVLALLPTALLDVITSVLKRI